MSRKEGFFIIERRREAFCTIGFSIETLRTRVLGGGDKGSIAGPSSNWGAEAVEVRGRARGGGARLIIPADVACDVEGRGSRGATIAPLPDLELVLRGAPFFLPPSG